MPPLGGPCRNIAIPFGAEKLELCGYIMAEKFKDVCNCFDRILACDRQTDRQTDILRWLRGKIFNKVLTLLLLLLLVCVSFTITGQP